MNIAMLIEKPTGSQSLPRRFTPFISLNQADAKGVKRLGKLWLPVGFSISMAMFIYLGLVLAHGG
ncbi:MAG: hypothetical protein AAFV96_12190 [Pseudomonadota bacterium]